MVMVCEDGQQLHINFLYEVGIDSMTCDDNHSVVDFYTTSSFACLYINYVVPIRPARTTNKQFESIPTAHSRTEPRHPGTKPRQKPRKNLAKKSP